MKILDLKQTCNFCPSQWEGWLRDGRMVYVRYRSGSLSITVSDEPTKDVDVAVRGECVLSVEAGHGWDGEMDTATMLSFAEKVYEPDPALDTTAIETTVVRPDRLLG